MQTAETSRATELLQQAIRAAQDARGEQIPAAKSIGVQHDIDQATMMLDRALRRLQGKE